MRALSRGSSETLRELVANDAPDGNFDGYNFWLNKLDAFEGNFIDAEMVRLSLSLLNTVSDSFSDIGARRRQDSKQILPESRPTYSTGSG